MLVSHRHKFIFTKTFKTAGTSIEHYFEPYCLPQGMRASGDEEIVSKEGVVGKRGAFGKQHQWYAHMPAAKIKDQLNEEKWASYFKFSVVRNPFDKMVSAYFFLLRLKQEQGMLPALKSRLKAWSGKRGEVMPGNHADHQINFRKWIKSGAHFDDSTAYKIEGTSVLDFTMRYEHLMEDLEQVCARLEIPFEPQRLKQLKSGYRKKKWAVKDLYDEESKSLVAERFRSLIDEQGYRFPDESN